MTIKQTLSRAREALTANNIEESSLEAEILLKHALQIDRVQLYQEFDRELSPEENEEFWSLIERRLNSEPTAYITGHREFYGLDFYVNSSVIIPRPESELLVEKAIYLAQKRNFFTIADIGTGCGTIAISLALSLTQAKIYATDISADALEVALINCQKHGVADRIHLLQGDLLDPLPEPVDLIAANPPYVRESRLPSVNTYNFEPSLALNGGPDGLEQIKRLCTQVADKLRPGGGLLLEIGQGQSKVVINLLHNQFPQAKIEVISDLSGIERVIGLTLQQDDDNILGKKV